MAQLVELSFLTPEIRVSNPVISKIKSTNLSTNCIIEKTKRRKKKRPGMAHLYKKTWLKLDSLVQGELLPKMALAEAGNGSSFKVFGQDFGAKSILGAEVAKLVLVLFCHSWFWLDPRKTPRSDSTLAWGTDARVLGPGGALIVTLTWCHLVPLRFELF